MEQTQTDRAGADVPAVDSTVLVVDDDVMVRELVAAGLEDRGFAVVTAESGAHALDLLRAGAPDLVVSDVQMPDMDGFELVTRLRSDPATRAVPLIFLTSRTGADDVVTGLRLGADDYVRKPFQLDEVVARVEAKLTRRPAAVDGVPADAGAVLREDRILAELEREAARARATGRAGAVVVLDLHERPTIRERYGIRGEQDMTATAAGLLLDGLGPVDRLGRDREGRFVLLLPETTAAVVRTRLLDLSSTLVTARYAAVGDTVHPTPTIGWAPFGPGDDDVDAATLLGRAEVARDAASAHLDLQPVGWTPALGPVAPPSTARRRRERPARSEGTRTVMQIAATFLAAVVLPFCVYVGLYENGLDISTPVYLTVVVALLVTGVSIWVEGFLALDPVRPPREPTAPPPPASAIIAAYLPNEAATVVETVEAFLRTDYPDLQVILAYNTPSPLPVEATLQRIAAQDPRFLPLRVEGSTSKAQNVNAALARVRGQFVGVFDADHQPAVDAFSRAWRWLSHGYDVVQGHCVVRNGDASVVARTVAVEFESIYAVSHPGRARLHGFGIFGGSNGYWRTEVLRSVRMHGFMLTEDIDSSLRVVEGGGRIANDPGLVSRELAPTTAGQLWNQRMRWAQGWFQVSLKHLRLGWASPHLGLQQKLGMTFLLGWREVYPWISLQMLPVIAFLAWRAGGVQNLDWWISVFVLTTLFTTTVGPGQTLFAWRLAAPEVRARRRWFWGYLLVSSLVYTEWKNIIARVAQVKELVGERQWKVTPRSAGTTTAPPVAAQGDAA